MQSRTKPYFIIKKNLQKSSLTGKYFSDVLTHDILEEVCYKITGTADFDCAFVDNDYEDEFLERTYNKGRLAILQYRDDVNYISFSELEIGGRNSSVQSVPTAFNMFYLNPYPRKHLYYYFLNNTRNAETNYQILFYRLMSTIGFIFLNANYNLSLQIGAFSSIDDIIFNRRINAGRNRSNNSTFITKSDSSHIEVYGKTYGANKYETSLICYALSGLCQPGQYITLYEVLEGNLKELPDSSLNVIAQMGNVEVVPTDMTLEKNIFDKNDSLRSPRYLFNLFNKLGNKRCALCNCMIPELIQGAHVWPVSDIKKSYGLTFDEKLSYAIDGDNGLWLCENHHKLFDEHILAFDDNGTLLYKCGMDPRSVAFIDEITRIHELPDYMMTDGFCKYLRMRNHAV